MKQAITVLGGGLAGCEAAFAIAEQGVPVVLREMKPDHYTPAHHEPLLAELVCSNSLKARRIDSAAGLLKEEMRRMGSLCVPVADSCAVPAGGALAVDREAFAAGVTRRIEQHPLITVERGRVDTLPDEGITVVATGPLTADEWQEMRRHPVTGYNILRRVADFQDIAVLVLHHHERWDGRGYPDGLSGTDIPLGSRIIAVADSIDAMMSSRSYRAAMTGAACRCEIEKNSGIMYDPRVANAALAHWDTLISRYTADTPRTPYFDRLMLERTRQTHGYLVAHQDSRITLAELAAKFHLSQSSLKLCFKALYGVPVAGYLRTVRMDTAARLLRESDLPVAEIAHRVGYEDPSRFSAAFRRHTGRRPTELRRVACPCAE